ncbi:MAG: hypothetical protein A2X56_11915 [Nitrospirae bacterium GWC2_57_13]|nr:MAG: hypothetical protein A2072_04320 [Nitrospirae bacterium GWC1_57_7]OGW29031.1 MAG: hypothetical protein A2X56_11915 [Nitrospirae bacterium GWC2_57_13]OGW41787.1 MAG: hypothetical protein A2X57_09020 [Nitrospirae bacterium GWD2_57_8]
MKYLILFAALFTLWMVWSGIFDAFHLSLGIISSALVTFMTHDLIFRREIHPYAFQEIIRFLKYIPWLLYQIVLSNLHVAQLALNPKMPIDPQLVKFKSTLKKDVSHVVFGNSITLTPGTITADIRDGEYYVHALSKKTAEDLLNSDMEQRIAHIFGEE